MAYPPLLPAPQEGLQYWEVTGVGYLAFVEVPRQALLPRTGGSAAHHLPPAACVSCGRGSAAYRLGHYSCSHWGWIVGGTAWVVLQGGCNLQPLGRGKW